MQKDFIFKFFQEFPPHLRELEQKISEDNVVSILNNINDMEKMLKKFKEQLVKEYMKAIKGES